MSGLGSSAPTEVDPTLAYFHALFARLGIEWCVAGAVAANAYRSPRDTTDLDLVVQIEASRYSAVAQALRADGWRLIGEGRTTPEEVLRITKNEELVAGTEVSQ